MLAILFVLATTVGFIGTVLGLGGGFILLPALMYLCPTESVKELVAISTAFIFFNAGSASITLIRKGRTNLRVGAIYSLCALPGAAYGAYLTESISRTSFGRYLGVILIAVALWTIFKNRLRWQSAVPQPNPIANSKSRLICGCMLSAVVGVVSSFFGIGGGIIHVPGMINLLGYSIPMATATSQFVITWTSLIALGEHILAGSLTFATDMARIGILGLGAIFGSQLGAHWGGKIRSSTISISLAILLGLIGLRFLLS